VLEAIISGDRVRAEELTRTRLDRLRERSRSSIQGNRGFRRHDASNGFRTTKLGEAIGEEIARQVASTGWARDTKIGTEDDLRKRFGVSHAIIREALSLLERHGIVYRQRGRTGGLLIRPPDPGYTVKVVTGFLRYLRLDAENFLDMRRLLEPEAAARAAARATPDTLQDLRDTLDRILEPGNTEAGRTFLVQVADASGNRVLSLFVQTLMGTFYTVPDKELTQAFRHGVHETLMRIYEAIAAHDLPLVRRRSIQHLDFAARCMQEGLVTI
jgi:DNA-binding FadR family transcriptional regulator